MGIRLRVNSKKPGDSEWKILEVKLRDDLALVELLDLKVEATDQETTIDDNLEYKLISLFQKKLEAIDPKYQQKVLDEFGLEWN